MNKYELTNETEIIEGRTLHRIRALKDFADIKEGTLGGWIESEKNLDQYGDAWVYGDARVYGNAALLWIGNIGSRNDTTTFFNSKGGEIFVVCGCFYGDIDEFAKAVKKTHGDNKYAKQYELAIQLAKGSIETSKEGEP